MNIKSKRNRNNKKKEKYKKGEWIVGQTDAFSPNFFWKADRKKSVNLNCVARKKKRRARACVCVKRENEREREMGGRGDTYKIRKLNKIKKKKGMC